MADIFITYHTSILICGLIATLFLLQLIIADIVLFFNKHQAGHPIESDHQSFVFRATRAHANTNESIAIYILLLLFGLLSQSAPDWLAFSSGLYGIARLAHMSFYYMNLQLARSCAFGLGLVGLLSMLITGLTAWV
ncbi:MAPEG family protein [Pseudoalteromonas sp. MMG013]|uniref:MAPEG family protein n=1 Tax=Pseudoalteromonas sp. MMG013 TaxID=2822687 RepID=UPI001B359BEA|nr:MAPEG family protein [Pseudoalteromonas sp. MMG013]MBQ4864001.1 MAPEG family protein [Pseudoalteromonas sp. MMG013]